MVGFAILIAVLGIAASVSVLRRGPRRSKQLVEQVPLLSPDLVSSAPIVTDDSYFFGQSEPVYPTPNGTGLGSWSDAYEKARALVVQLTLEEKVGLTGGVLTNENGCGGWMAPIKRLGFPGLCLQDAGNGVRSTDYVNAYPAGLHIGASWNKALIYARAYQMGGEFRRKGANVALGPVVGPLGRVAKGGRNWEGFGSDPYHAGVSGALSVRGIQDQGVMASIKHYVGNEQELHRNIEKDEQGNQVLSVSSNMDDTTLHELYLWPFVDAIRAGSATVMCSYNRLNNSYACQNSKALNGVLKGELGFQGLVLSDWHGVHGGVAAALAGLDVAMPSGAPFWGDHLTEAVKNSSVPESRINDMATRVLAAWYQTRQDEDFPVPGLGIPRDVMAAHPLIEARVPEARAVLLQNAIEGHVLVKNTNRALPLRTPKVLSLFGYDAVAPRPNAPRSGTFNDWSLGTQSSSYLGFVCGMASSGYADCPPAEPTARNGTLVTGEGSGATAPAYISAPFDAIQQQAIEDGTQLYWDFVNINATGFVHPHSTAALVFINAAAGEGIDRPSLGDKFSDDLVVNIANQHNNTMVVLHNAGIRILDPWIDHPNVSAVLVAHLPGQDSGRALVELLYGRQSPSGKLPYSIARSEKDYGRLLNPEADEGKDGEFRRFPQSDFAEGNMVDYRYFDARGLDSRFEFGFGLSYSEFEFSGFEIRSTMIDESGHPIALSAHARAPIECGGRADLFDVLYEVDVKVTNVGGVSAHEVAQLYVRIPAAGRPAKQLRGFEKLFLQPGETKEVTFELTRRDLSYWDVVAQEWALVLGEEYEIYVGNSSRSDNLVLRGRMAIETSHLFVGDHHEEAL